MEKVQKPSNSETSRDSLPIDMLLSAVSVFVIVLPSSEILEGLMNYPVYDGLVPIHFFVPVRTLEPKVHLTKCKFY
jgi:hypothetical protein